MNEYTEVDGKWLDDLEENVPEDRDYRTPYYFYTRDMRDLIRLARIGLAHEPQLAARGINQ